MTNHLIIRVVESENNCDHERIVTTTATSASTSASSTGAMEIEPNEVGSEGDGESEGEPNQQDNKEDQSQQEQSQEDNEQQMIQDPTNQQEQPKTVFEWNSDAVAQIQRGEYEAAISTLDKAVACLTELSRTGGGFHFRPGLVGYGSQDDLEEKFDVSLMAVPLQVAGLNTAEANVSNTSRNASDDEYSYRLFPFALTTVFLEYEGTKGIGLTKGLVLYNLGLCYHRKAMQYLEGGSGSGTGTSSTSNNISATSNDATRAGWVEANFTRAIFWYKGALMILQRQEEEYNGEEEDPNERRRIPHSPAVMAKTDFMLLVLALMNNLGHVYNTMEEYDEARRCIVHMYLLLQSSGETSSPLVLLMDQHGLETADFFATNVTRQLIRMRTMFSEE